MRIKTVLISMSVVLTLLAIAVVTVVSLHTSSAPSSSKGLPAGVTLRQIDGGPHYYAHIDPASAWMDQHIMVGAWLEQPLTATEVGYDVAMGNNIYWNLAGDLLDTKDCGGNPALPCQLQRDTRCRDACCQPRTSPPTSGSETVAYEGTDEPDLNFGPGFNGWNPRVPITRIPVSQQDPGADTLWLISFTVASPASYGSPGYPVGKKPITQGFGKGVLFWETDGPGCEVP